MHETICISVLALSLKLFVMVPFPNGCIEELQPVPKFTKARLLEPSEQLPFMMKSPIIYFLPNCPIKE